MFFVLFASAHPHWGHDAALVGAVDLTKTMCAGVAVTEMIFPFAGTWGANFFPDG